MQKDRFSRRLLATCVLAAPFGRFSLIRAEESNWQHDVQRMLTEFLSCQTPIDDRSPCNYFLARAMKRVYGVGDFFRSKDTPLSANEIASYVASDRKWTSLGMCDSQYNLNQAQGYANLKKPVLAVYRAEPHGHVALVLPGSQSLSPSWALKVPNSASFPLDNPRAAYVGGPLSKAFGAEKKQKVEIFGRNFSPTEG